MADMKEFYDGLIIINLYLYEVTTLFGYDLILKISHILFVSQLNNTQYGQSHSKVVKNDTQTLPAKKKCYTFWRYCSVVILLVLCHLFCEVCTDIKWIKTIGKEIEEEKRNFSFKDFLCNFVSIKVLCFQLSRKCIDQHQCSDQAIFLTSLIALLRGLGRKNTHKKIQWAETIAEEACLFW